MDVNAVVSGWILGISDELGDPEQLRQHAERVRAQSAQLSELTDAMDREVAALAWTGTAAQAHLESWSRKYAAAQELTAAMDAGRQQLERHTEGSLVIARTIVGLLLELVELLAAGYALTWLTAGLSDLLWARAVELMVQIERLLTAFRSAMSSFAAAARELGVVAGRIGATIESLVIDFAPAYVRAFAGFYLGAAVPQAMSGRPVDWAGNAWQVAAFVGLDATFNLGWNALEATRAGGAMRRFVTGEPAPPGSAAAAEAGPASVGPPKLPTFEFEQVERSPLASERTSGESIGSTSPASPMLPVAEPLPASSQAGFVPMTGRQAVWSGLKEGINTGTGNVVLSAAAAAKDHTKLNGQDLAVSAALGFGMAGTRQGLYHYLPYGQPLAHAKAPEGAPSWQRWLAETPVSWSYYDVYFVLKDALVNVIHGTTPPTELSRLDPDVPA
ncbi:WXG100 family type VII secretion target [Angustibacter sp. McL0619]|uniref:WXG100 family type VII secretion target n=1 Tax=Angustibacter sp. McL0619 TaxID=3415676 RepID=UPI003CFB5B61